VTGARDEAITDPDDPADVSARVPGVGRGVGQPLRRSQGCRGVRAARVIDATEVRVLRSTSVQPGTGMTVAPSTSPGLSGMVGGARVSGDVRRVVPPDLAATG
jgi:hypothetical protein